MATLQSEPELLLQLLGAPPDEERGKEECDMMARRRERGSSRLGEPWSYVGGRWAHRASITADSLFRVQHRAPVCSLCSLCAADCITPGT